MDTLPAEDYTNASRYAHQAIVIYRYQHQAKETRWKLPRYHLLELKEDPTLYLPPALKAGFKRYTLAFDEAGCRQLNCFRYTATGDTCPPKAPPITYTLAGQVYEACQPACWQNWMRGTEPMLDEVAFRQGKCERKLTLFKKWCLFPSTRSDEAPDPAIPPFQFDEATESCLITEPYCQYFGLDFTPPNACHLSGGQAFAEDYLVGKTIYRTFKILDTAPSTLIRSKRSLTEEADSLLAFLNSAAFDASLDMAFAGARQLALKSIHLYATPTFQLILAQLETVYGKLVVKHAVVGAVIHSVKAGLTAQIAIKAAAYLGTASTVVGAILLGIQLAGLVTDLIDPLKLNERVDQPYLDQVKLSFRTQLHSILQGHVEVEPLAIMAWMTENELNQEEHALLIRQMAIYLFHLDVSARGVYLKGETEDTLEDYLQKWTQLLHRQTPKEVETTMNKYFTQGSLISAILLGLFLAVSI